MSINYTEAELLELYHERCAIREHDGQLPRDKAEEAAYYDFRRIVGRNVVVPDEIRAKVRKFKRA